MNVKTARLFQNGGSQAVRLPAEFRFEGDRVFIRRDARTGDVVLSERGPASWADFVALRKELGGAPADFLRDRRQSTETRDPFDEWHERDDAPD